MGCLELEKGKYEGKYLLPNSQTISEALQLIRALSADYYSLQISPKIII